MNAQVSRINAVTQPHPTLKASLSTGRGLNY